MSTTATNTAPERPQAPIYREGIILVECNGTRHLAQQDERGKWKTLSRHKELRGQVEVIKVVR